MARGSIQSTHDHPTQKGSISTLIVGEKDSLVGNHEVLIDGKTYTISKEWLARKVLAQMLEFEFDTTMHDEDLPLPSLDDLIWEGLANSAISVLAGKDTDFRESLETMGLDTDKVSAEILFPGCEFHVDHDVDQTGTFSRASIKTIYR